MTAINPQLWTEFVNGSQEARNKLLTAHLGLVHYVARQLSRTVRANADLDEMVSAGTIGLMEALEGFDPARGLAFSTFAAPRIRGAILDELREQDHVPRSVRRKARDLAQARETLQHRTGRAPGAQEVARQLGIDTDTVWKWEADVAYTVQLPLDHPAGEFDERSPLESLPDATYGDIEETLNHEQEVALLRDALLQLKPQERTVLSLYYFEGLKLHEIASLLSITESRVSQVRSKALARLRGKLGGVRVMA